ncbi:MAG: hypothetical protein WC406_13270 [Methanoregula sp.]
MIAMLRGVYRAMKAMVFGSRAEAEGVPDPMLEVSGSPVDGEEMLVPIPDGDATIVQAPEISPEPEIVDESPPSINEDIGNTTTAQAPEISTEPKIVDESPPLTTGEVGDTTTAQALEISSEPEFVDESPPLTTGEVGDTTPVQAPEISSIPATVESSATPDTGNADAAPATTVSGAWAVRTIVDPVFVKVGRMYLDEGDLVIRSDRDSRVFLLPKEEIDPAFAGDDVPVLLLDLSATVGTAHLSTSGRALNIVIDQQLHTVPLRSLIPMLNGKTRKAPLFVPKEDVAPDPQ